MPVLVFLAASRGIMTLPRQKLADTVESMGDEQPFVIVTLLFGTGLFNMTVVLALSLIATGLLYILDVVMILWTCVKLLRENCC